MRIYLYGSGWEVNAAASLRTEVFHYIGRPSLRKGRVIVRDSLTVNHMKDKVNGDSIRIARCGYSVMSSGLEV